SFVGRNYAFRPYFDEAAGGHIGRFYGVGVTTGEAGYFLAAQLRTAGSARGVIAVKLSLLEFENAIKDSGETVLLADHDGVVFLSAVPEWRYRVLEPLSAPVRTRIERTQQYGNQALRPLPLAQRYSVSSRTVGGLD